MARSGAGVTRTSAWLDVAHAGRAAGAAASACADLFERAAGLGDVSPASTRSSRRRRCCCAACSRAATVARASALDLLAADACVTWAFEAAADDPATHRRPRRAGHRGHCGDRRGVRMSDNPALLRRPAVGGSPARPRRRRHRRGGRAWPGHRAGRRDGARHGAARRHAVLLRQRRERRRRAAHGHRVRRALQEGAPRDRRRSR